MGLAAQEAFLHQIADMLVERAAKKEPSVLAVFRVRFRLKHHVGEYKDRGYRQSATLVDTIIPSGHFSGHYHTKHAV